MRMPLYTAWADPLFYAYAAAFAAALFSLIYSISRWLELKNEALYQDELPPLPAEVLAEGAPPTPEAAPAPSAEVPLEAAAGENPAPAPQPVQAQDDLEAWINELPDGEKAAAQADPDKTVVVPNIAELVEQATRAAAADMWNEAAPAGGQPEPAASCEEPAAAAPSPAAEPEIYLPEPEARPAPAAAPEPAAAGHGGAEECVKGIYEHLAGMTARLAAIEDAVGTSGSRRNFTIKFIEGLLEDYESLGKDKLKARVNYLLADLKENQERPSK